jgi:hypothetical protein
MAAAYRSLRPAELHFRRRVILGLTVLLEEIAKQTRRACDFHNCALSSLEIATIRWP